VPFNFDHAPFKSLGQSLELLVLLCFPLIILLDQGQSLVVVLLLTGFGGAFLLFFTLFLCRGFGLVLDVFLKVEVDQSEGLKALHVYLNLVQDALEVHLLHPIFVQAIDEIQEFLVKIEFDFLHKQRLVVFDSLLNDFS